MLGKINSWTIRWVYNQFKLKKFTVFPKCAKAINIGSDDKALIQMEKMGYI